MTTPTTLYLSGPMTGYNEYNYPAFERATKALRSQGFTVVSPHELDADLFPDFDASIPNSFTQEDRRTALRHDINHVLWDVEGVATLAFWFLSEGAKLEVAVAEAIGLPVKPVTHWLDLGTAA